MLCGLALLFALWVCAVGARNFRVGNADELRDAVRRAAAGDRIMLDEGDYELNVERGDSPNRAPLVLDRALTLTCKPDKRAVLYNNGFGSLIEVRANNVRIYNLRIGQQRRHTVAPAGESRLVDVVIAAGGASAQLSGIRIKNVDFADSRAGVHIGIGPGQYNNLGVGNCVLGRSITTTAVLAHRDAAFNRHLEVKNNIIEGGAAIRIGSSKSPGAHPRSFARNFWRFAPRLYIGSGREPSAVEACDDATCADSGTALPDEDNGGQPVGDGPTVLCVLCGDLDASALNGECDDINVRRDDIDAAYAELHMGGDGRSNTRLVLAGACTTGVATLELGPSQRIEGVGADASLLRAAASSEPIVRFAPSATSHSALVNVAVGGNVYVAPSAGAGPSVLSTTIDGALHIVSRGGGTYRGNSASAGLVVELADGSDSARAIVIDDNALAAILVSAQGSAEYTVRIAQSRPTGDKLGVVVHGVGAETSTVELRAGESLGSVSQESGSKVRVVVAGNELVAGANVALRSNSEFRDSTVPDTSEVVLAEFAGAYNIDVASGAKLGAPGDANAVLQNVRFAALSDSLRTVYEHASCKRVELSTAGLALGASTIYADGKRALAAPPVADYYNLQGVAQHCPSGQSMERSAFKCACAPGVATVVDDDDDDDDGGADSGLSGTAIGVIIAVSAFLCVVIVLVCIFCSCAAREAGRAVTYAGERPDAAKMHGGALIGASAYDYDENPLELTHRKTV